MKEKTKKRKQLKPVTILALGFLSIILCGGIILSLPISSASGEFTNFIDALFTATSAVCVTGLVTVDTATYWNVFGQTIIAILLQIGGLGFMAFATFGAMIAGKKITLHERTVMNEALNADGMQGLVKMMRKILILTFLVEAIGAFLLSFIFIPEYGWSRGIGYSIFHSISAFCNGGFDLMGNFSSLTNYNTNSYILIVISILIIIGGLGFTVTCEILSHIFDKKERRKKFSMQTKLVVLITGGLIVFGSILFFMLEYKNPATIRDMSLTDKIMNCVFTSVSPRTAGFNSISTEELTESGKFVTIILMFIGGSPGSTAGGIKTTTFGILLLTIFSSLKGRDDTEIFSRRFSKETVYKAFTLFALGIIIVILDTFILSILEYEETFIDLFYEATSAFGTAGLTTGVTQRIGTASKIILMITMYLGRVGPVTVLLAIMKRKKPNNSIKYPEAKIPIG